MNVIKREAMKVTEIVYGSNWTLCEKLSVYFTLKLKVDLIL
jgi:hypothetical protein